MKRLELSDRAEASLSDIALWTLERFGRAQMDRYVDELLAKSWDIAAGRAHHQSCRTIFADDLRDNLRFARAGSHYVIFVETETEVQIVDFLHQNADIAGRLG